MERIEIIQTRNDIEKITKVINLSFKTVADDFGFTRQGVPTFPAYIEPVTIENQISKGLCLYGIIKGDRFGGSIGISKSKDMNAFKIERLAVLPEYRHHGVGKKLMDFAYAEIVKNSGTIAQVEIVNENAQLKSWYERDGFFEIRIDTYRHLPFTVCVMNKELGKR